MPTQTVVFTPPIEISTEEALSHISTYLTSEVLTFLSESTDNGGRSSITSVDNNTHTVTTTWTDESASQYVTLMTDVSASAKASLISDGWTISFTPETADL